MQEKEAELKFEREELHGVIAVGTYLFDGARRMGVEVECERMGESDSCAMKVTAGGEFLSEVTKAEIKQLSEERRKAGERLACQAKIERVGEVKIMTTKKKEEEKPDYEVKKEAYRKEFEELPLEKKIASLVELEAIALGDTFSFIINSPYKLVGKFMDVLAEFGLKMDEEAKKQTRPKEILQKIITEGESNFGKVFRKFNETAGVYGFGDLQVKRIYDEVWNANFSSPDLA